MGNYPSQIDNTISLPTVLDNLTPVQGSVVNRLRDSILAIQTELGIKPSGVYTTVRNRLDTLEAIINSGGSVLFGGDLDGLNGHQTVIGLQGLPVANVTPTTNQALIYNGSQWLPQNLPAAFTAGGDLSGSNTNQTVIRLQNTAVSNVTPTLNQSLIFNGTQWAPGVISGAFTAGGDLSGTNSNQTVIRLYNNPLASTTPVNSAVPVWDSSIYDIRQLTQDDILPGFTINSFSGGSVVECGATVTNPAFSASYSSSATSAQITNTDNIDSPLVLSNPYVSGTVVGSFSHAGVNSGVTFTLSANKNSINKMATSSITFEARSFGGVGSAGASSATASGNTAVLDSSLGTLSNEGLHSSDVGQAYGPFSPSSQKIYLLLPHTGSAHTFKDQNGFNFVMNAPTTFSFTNQNSAAISMDLYESTNLLSTNFTISVVT